MQKQWTCLFGQFLNGAKPENWRKEMVEIADIAEHSKQNDQRNTQGPLVYGTVALQMRVM